MYKTIKRRETFYLSGFDPRGARYYYNLYKKEAALQSIVNGIEMKITSRKRTDQYIQSWSIDASSHGRHTTTNYHFLEWDDIIRDNWKKNFWTLVKDLIFYFKTYILAGRFIKYMRVSPRQMVGIFFPIIFTMVSISASIILGNVLYDCVNGMQGLFLGVGFALTILYFLLKLGNRLALFWLLRIFVFSARYVFEKMHILDSRLLYFSNQISTILARQKENQVDEVLLVVHSVGAILLIDLLEKLFKEKNLAKDAKVSILVLGECIPLVSGIDRASEYRKKMAFVAKQYNLFWVDYTTVIDGACFPYLNYFSDVNVPLVKEKNFHFLSARFHTLFSNQRYKILRKNRYLTHFIYLMSTELSGEYDYFKMTAGHERLSTIINKGTV